MAKFITPFLKTRKTKYKRYTREEFSMIFFKGINQKGISENAVFQMASEFSLEECTELEQI